MKPLSFKKYQTFAFKYNINSWLFVLNFNALFKPEARHWNFPVVLIVFVRMGRLSGYSTLRIFTYSSVSILSLYFPIPSIKAKSSYRYEELSKRYEALLKAFNDKCSVVNAKNQTIARLRQRARVMHAQLASAHKTLLCVGEKYLTLKRRRHEQVSNLPK